MILTNFSSIFLKNVKKHLWNVIVIFKNKGYTKDDLCKLKNCEY